MKKMKLPLLLIPFAFSQLFSGCATANLPRSSPSLNSGSSTVLAEKTPSSVISKTPTLKLTFTLTPVLTMTTLNPQEKAKMLQDLFENEGSCQLPCYWGIVPGETLWSDALIFPGSLGQKVYGPGGTTRVADYSIYFEEIDVSPVFWVENGSGTIKAIGLNGYEIRRGFDYSLSGILKTVGVPEEIWIRSVAKSSDDQPYYYLVLMYPSQGILVSLHGNAEKQDWYLAICPQDMSTISPLYPTLILWNPKEQVSFDNFGNRLLDNDLGWVLDEYRPFQTVSDGRLTNQEFYNVYSEPNTKTCVKVLPVLEQ